MQWLAIDVSYIYTNRYIHIDIYIYLDRMEASQQMHKSLLRKTSSRPPSCWNKLWCCFRSRTRDEKRQSSEKKMTVTFDDDFEIFKESDVESDAESDLKVETV